MAQAAPKLKKKLVVLLIVFGLLFLVLALRLAQVQLIMGPDLQKKATSQWTRRTQLTAQRGRITDRNGLVLAQSGTSYRVLVNPQVIAEDERVRVALEVSEILDLDYDYVYERVSNTDRQQAQLKRKVEADVVAQLTALQLGGGISFSTDTKRYYPFGSLFAQLVGFTGIDSEGQTGIEASYDKYLAGEDGMLITETDRKNRPLSYGDETYIPPTDGYDMQLTVDSVTQSYLEKALEECLAVNRATTATGIVMDPSTGEILAEATYPSFDLNNPPRSEVTELMSMSRNRVVTDTYEPGSIFKIVTLAAALDSGTVDLNDEFTCKGSIKFRQETIHCWKTNGHDKQTLTQAVENSCNCAFMQMAIDMGVETFYNYIYKFGFGVSTDCGIPGEDTGEIIHRKYIRDADLARIGFGQTITVTSMQMAAAASAAVNGGVLMKPYVVSGITATDGTVIEENQPTELTRVIQASTSDKVRQILKSVVDNGSGSNAQLPGYAVGGKTGTAQKYDDDGTVSRTRLIASFIGFLPAGGAGSTIDQEAPAANPAGTEDQQLLCLITVDEPTIPVVYGSTVAAPFVKQVFEDLVQYYGILPDNTETTAVRDLPNTVGMTGEEALAALERAGFQATLIESEKQAIVTLQLPASDGEKTKAPKNSIVVLYTTMTTFSDEGLYKPMSTVPDLIGRRRLDALDRCTAAGLTLNYDKSACVGLIESQSIPAGEVVEPGTEIFVTFPVALPNTPVGEGQ